MGGWQRHYPLGREVEVRWYHSPERCVKLERLGAFGVVAVQPVASLGYYGAA